MTSEEIAALPIEDRLMNLELIREQAGRAVREALLVHKLLGNPVAVWQNGRVEMVQPEDIPVRKMPDGSVVWTTTENGTSA